MSHHDCAPLLLLSIIYLTDNNSTYIAETAISDLMTTSCVTAQRNHALDRWGALGCADNRSALETRIMSRIVARLFALASQHTASRSAFVARRSPRFIRSLSSSQGGVPRFFFDTSICAASFWLLHLHHAEMLPQIIENKPSEVNVRLLIPLQLNSCYFYLSKFVSTGHVFKILPLNLCRVFLRI